jgi:glycosyltransferase involved in cell wall biosynthesis
MVGAGYREEVFGTPAAPVDRAGQALFVGKYSRAKGLPWLLEAVAALDRGGHEIVLHTAGGGAGPETARLKGRFRELGPLVTDHGRLDPPDLAELMRRCAVCVLPSFFEGLPLVLVEARACGCRLVATDLPGSRALLAPALGEDLILIAPPRLTGPDEPDPADLPAFTERLTAALAAALAAGPPTGTTDVLAPFTWNAVYRRIAAIWLDLLRGGQGAVAEPPPSA